MKKKNKNRVPSPIYVSLLLKNKLVEAKYQPIRKGRVQSICPLNRNVNKH